MRWPTHQAGAIASALFLHLSPAGIVAAIFGGVLPDTFDQKLAGLLFRNKNKGWGTVHRGITHWWGLWAAFLLFCLAGDRMGLLAGLLRETGIGLAVGGMSHVLLDMLTPKGVPVLPFAKKPRMSLKLCSTGGLGEWCVLAAIVIGTGIFLQGDSGMLLYDELSRWMRRAGLRF